MVRRLPAWMLLVAALDSAPAAAQTKEAFVEALVDFVTALEGETGQEGPVAAAALDRMARALAAWDEAILRYEDRLAREAPGAPPAAAAAMHATMAVIYLDRGRIDAALRALDAAVRLGARDAGVHRLRGLAYEAIGRRKDAAEAYAAADRIAPAAPPFVTISLVDDGAATAPVFPLVLYAEGFSHLGAREYERAVEAWRAALRSDPLVARPAASDAEGSEARRLRGRALAAGGQHDAAIAELRAAIRLDPHNERARLALADVLVEAGRAADAEAALLDTIEALPRSGGARWRLGRLYRTLQRDDEALSQFEAAAGEPPFIGAAHLWAAIGYLHHARFDLEAAARAYERRVALTPNDAAARRDLAELYLAQDRHADALREFTFALALAPRDPRALTGAGHASVALGRDEDAIGAFRRALGHDPSLAEALYALSRALLRTGRHDEARQALERYEQLQREALEQARRAREEEVRRAEEALGAAGAGR